jgi:hypothetical protein
MCPSGAPRARPAGQPTDRWGRRSRLRVRRFPKPSLRHQVSGLNPDRFPHREAPRGWAVQAHHVWACRRGCFTWNRQMKGILATSPNLPAWHTAVTDDRGATISLFTGPLPRGSFT